ncbi:MAG TPA: hypothetical protein VFG04_30045, partial [Planctomycetaceae bacterium]|nr:hypothetical protein [Planctomycetaceae bacterium]
MKTIARTALLGLLVSASLQTLAWADDPNPPAANVFAPNPTAGSTPSGKVSLDAAPAPSPSRVQPTAGHVTFDSQPADASTPPTIQNGQTVAPNSQAPGQVAYDSMPGQATWNNPFGVGDGPFGPTFFLNGNFGRGVGWDGSSYQADLYYPWHVVPGQSAVFGVLQGGVDDYGRCYTTGGIGYRE